MALEVNMKLLPVKATYFFEVGAVASLLPYVGVYMFSIGLTPSELSIIFGTSPFVTAILRTFIGMLADKLQKHKLVLMLCCVFSGLFHGILLLTPRTADEAYSICNVPVALNCGNEGSLIQHCQIQEICNNGNCTTMDPFVNASNCITSCITTENDAKCLSNFENNLIINGCTGNQTAPRKVIISHDVLIPIEKTHHNCSDYKIIDFTYLEYSYESMLCPDHTDIGNCQMNCSGTPPYKLESMPSCEQKKSGTFGKTFWFFFSFYLIGQIFFAPIFSMVDALVYCYLNKAGGQWGRQRLWGTVGFAVFAIISGFVMDAFPDLGDGKNFDNFLFAFILFAVLSISGGLVVMCYKISENVVSAQLLTNLRQLLSRFPVIILLCNIFMFGLYTGIIETFLFVRLQEIGAPKLLMGLCMVINCLPEIVILLFAGKIIERLRIFGSLCIVYTAYCVRLFVYAFLTSPWYTLLVEPLHSITFGLMYATVSYHGNQITPPGMQGTIQNIIGAFYFGFGKGFGSIISGQVYQYFGPQATFLGFAISGVVCLLAFILIHVLCLKKIVKPELSEKQEKNGQVLEAKEFEMKKLNASAEIVKENNGRDNDIHENLVPESESLVENHMG